MPAVLARPARRNRPLQALAEYARSTKVWVCASETLGSRWAYKEYLDRDALHVAMVDLSWTGGLTEGRKIASMAATYHRPFAPHDCIGPISFAAAVHDDGFIRPMEGPGLGTELLPEIHGRTDLCRRHIAL